MINKHNSKSKKNDKLVVRLIPDFQKELFSRLIFTIGTIQAATRFGKSRRLFYHYRNCRVNYIPYDLVKTAAILVGKTKELEDNILESISFAELVNKNLKLGRTIHTKKIREKFNKKIEITKVIQKEGNYFVLNISKWWELTGLEHSLKTNICEIIKVAKSKDKITIFTKVYTHKGKIRRKIQLPIKLLLDENFFYFLGLYFGDGTRGSRVGICNKEVRLIKWVATYLSGLFSDQIYMDLMLQKRWQNSQLDPLINKIKPFAINKIFYNKMFGDYVFITYIVNKTIERILKLILNNISILIQMKPHFINPFLAGLFDAEGNVNFRDNVLRISQKNKENCKLINVLLEKVGFGFRYDGSNFVIANTKLTREGDFKLFSERIWPYLKHPQKKANAMALINGRNYSEKDLLLVKIVNENPGITNREIAKIIGRKRNQSYLSTLTSAGFITRCGERGKSFKYYPITLNSKQD
ncbi:MAG: hypothetical protein KAT43_00140 [Nanoarchaeota archaeon]|nr:hypothetical protein [Nanoarchaeota archaeon]